MIKQQVFQELFENFTPFSPEVLIYLFYVLLSRTLQYLTSLVIFTESPGIRLQNCLVPACVRSDISSHISFSGGNCDDNLLQKQDPSTNPEVRIHVS